MILVKAGAHSHPDTKRVYVAGPIGALEGRAERVREAIAMGDKIFRAGCAPFVPHLLCQWNDLFEHHYEEWMALDFIWLKQCQAIFRMAGVSPGADREVELAKSLGMPVFTDLAELRRWAHAAEAPVSLVPVAQPEQVAAAAAHNIEMAAYCESLKSYSIADLQSELSVLLRDSYDPAKSTLALNRMRLAERALAKLKETSR